MAKLTATAIITVAITGLALFIVNLTINRRHVRKLQAAKGPMPKFHPIFGHFLALKECIESFPRNATMHVVIQHMAKQFPKGIFYLNLWPFNKTLMVIASPFVASQVEAAVLNKPDNICTTLDLISGGPSIMTMHGSTWKMWRGLFNPGFAGGYMIGLAPAIADEVAVFCELVKGLAKKGDVVQLEEYTLRLTFDVISRVTLDARLHYQTQGSALADCLRRQVYWTSFGTTFNPIRRYLSPRPLVQRYNSYRMNQYLDGEIDKRFEELALSRQENSKGSQASSRSIISLAMNKYLEDVGTVGDVSRKAFKELAKPQLRMFLFAGHDTTSSTLLYCYFLLSRHPEALSKMRSEHDGVFGSDFSIESCTQAIHSDPTLLNKIPYTAAVIKEVLRIFPPAGSIREGRSDLILTDEDGHQYPTENCHIWTLTLAMHHNPSIFPQPEDFIPKRWLVGPEDPLYPKKGSWRPFEWGLRNCIGQTLAQLELKVALVMTGRMFDITPAYEEWDRVHPGKGKGGMTVGGNRAYQAEMGGGGAHPADGFPVRVTLRR
ncbi:cytochrome P450 [Hypoxylon trugodes]|uniref:cytochrome P450 n=1 Tax=Hypoxylon trugodes TaxID=326681 RepID=UPI0021966487|nr:cytochrome P450 [Hypoxylon trugodes]KAI1391051.1 cytochrome P450 [Hypoxylon trugodes]